MKKSKEVIRRTVSFSAIAAMLILASSCGSHGKQSGSKSLENQNGESAQSAWHLVWQDEFNGKSGSTPDSAKWTYDTGGNGWGNQELEFYTDSRKNSYLDGKGHLIIKAVKELNFRDTYTSARLKTQGLFAQKYGKVEARIKIPYGQGIWPAFWMLGSNISEVGWPKSGEIDIVENIGKEPSIIHGTAHGPGSSGEYGIGAPYTLSDGKHFADDYHLYGIEWDENEVSWYLDGKKYFKMDKSDLTTDQTWVFDHPYFILLNVAVGGSWPGNPDDSTVFPQKMLVDYVKVYQHQAASSLSG